jgi:hypothetical protein
MERYVADHLTKYLTDHNLLHKFQFGFQKGKGTTDLLLLFSDFINRKLNEIHHVLCLFFYFTKAFDTLNHKKLIFSLEKIGI